MGQSNFAERQRHGPGQRPRRFGRAIENQFRGGSESPIRPEARKTISESVAIFLADKAAQGIDPTAHKKYTRELGRFAEFMSRRGRHFPQEIRLEDLIEYRAGWLALYPASLTRSKVQERLRGFLRHLRDAKLIDDVPKLSAIRVDTAPTLPLTDKEYAKLLDAISAEFSGPKALRVRALVRLMRHSGLAIQDAVTLAPREIRYDASKALHRVVTSRQKTGTHVSVALPPDAAAEILAAAPLNGNPDYLFWNRTGNGQPKAAVDVWERAFKRIFNAAGLLGGHSHQLRDTFAVDLLEKGVPLEELSKLLGHTSIKTTERSYAPWVKSRQDRLDTLVTGTWKTV